MDELWTDKEVSNFLKIDANTLAGWRSSDKGPPFVKLPTGAVRYQPEEVKQWAISNRRRGKK